MASNKIKDCSTQLRRVWPFIKKDFETKFPKWKIKITHTHRTPEEQFNLYKKGRKYNQDKKYWIITNYALRVTNRDGTKRLSDHNYYPSKAFDVALRNPQHDYTWNTNLPQWLYIPILCKKHGILNGSKWKGLKDFPHCYIA